METRIIVADSARARIFISRDMRNHLEEQADFVHPEAHLLNQDLVADGPGKSRDAHGLLDYSTSPREHEAQNFARLLARHLKEMHNEQHFEQLILIAPPKFLGLLRKELPGPLDQILTRSIDKDLTLARVEEIFGYIKS